MKDTATCPTNPTQHCYYANLLNFFFFTSSTETVRAQFLITSHHMLLFNHPADKILPNKSSIFVQTFQGKNQDRKTLLRSQESVEKLELLFFSHLSINCSLQPAMGKCTPNLLELLPWHSPLCIHLSLLYHIKCNFTSKAHPILLPFIQCQRLTSLKTCSSFHWSPLTFLEVF